MSAITGIFYRDGRFVDEKQIKKMNDRLSHRGPDGSAIWCEGSVALGHQMLHTTPESLHEKLPFEEDGLVITADARIDNRRELSEKLDIEDIEEVSDSFFILKAYQKWGEKCPEELLGDFAFAIWDKNEEKLFFARDHMGVKPFYYYLSDEVFYFASEIKAILIISEIIEELNELKLALYLIPSYSEREQTFYEGILRLPAANSIVINNHKLKLIEYWKLNPKMEIKMDSDVDYIKKFLEIFIESVKCRLRTPFKVGFELSGGMDSSSIVSTAKKILNDNNQFSKINTFSNIFKDIPETDESYFIMKIVNSGGISPNYLEADQIPLLNQVEDMFTYLDEPVDSPMLPINLKLYKKMQDNHIRVLFSGFGGDTTLYRGRNYFNELAIKFKWNKLYKECRGYSKRLNTSFYKILLNIILSITPEYMKKIYKSIKNVNNRYEFSLVNRKLMEKINGKKSLSKNSLLIRINSKKTHYSILTSPFHQHALELLNQTYASFSIDVRYPFYDKRVIEFCNGIPTEQKFKDGWDKMILRRAMEDVLPKEIQWRPSKVNFNAVIEKNISLFDQDFMDRIKDEILTDFVDLEYIRGIQQRNKGKRFESDLTDIMRLIVLETWLKWRYNVKKINIDKEYIIKIPND